MIARRKLLAWAVTVAAHVAVVAYAALPAPADAQRVGSRVTRRTTARVAPPPPSGDEGPHDYFDDLVNNSGYHYRSWPLRSQSNIDSVTFNNGCAGNVHGQMTHYIWPDDSFADAQDAAKIVLPTNCENYNQLRMPISIGAEFLGVSQVSAMVVWDFYWDISYVLNKGGLEGYKSFQLSRHDDKIYFEPRNRLETQATPLGGLSWFDVRGYSPVTFLSGHTRGGANAIYNGRNYGNDTIGPMESDFLIKPNMWTRFIATFTFTAGSTYATNVNFEISDEETDTTPILSGVTMFWPANNNVSAGGLLHKLWIEFNSSQPRPAGDIIMYVRNVAVLRDVPDYTVYRRRPVR